jgi:hypothetical protein
MKKEPDDWSRWLRVLIAMAGLILNALRFWHSND